MNGYVYWDKTHFCDTTASKSAMLLSILKSSSREALNALATVLHHCQSLGGA